MMRKIATSLLSKASGLNWYKYGAIAALAVAYSGGLFGLVYHKASVKCEQAKAEEAEQKVREVVKEVEVRVPVVLEREVESAKAKAEIKRLKGELDEALSKRPENPSCDLSDAELDGFRKLSDQTKGS